MYESVVDDAYPGPQRPMLAAQLRLASEACHAHLFTMLRTRGFDLRPSLLDLFRFPGPHGVTPTRLAAHLGLSKQALNPLLNELEDLGYLTRVANPTDGRSRTLELTPQGLELVTAIREILDDLEAQALARLGPTRYHGLLHSIKHIQELATPELPTGLRPP
jgi:DNA-binding MarR family transcriptional regulator